MGARATVSRRCSDCDVQKLGTGTGRLTFVWALYGGAAACKRHSLEKALRQRVRGLLLYRGACYSRLRFPASRIGFSGHGCATQHRSCHGDLLGHLLHRTHARQTGTSPVAQQLHLGWSRGIEAIAPRPLTRPIS
jgi:hypothetical protein